MYLSFNCNTVLVNGLACKDPKLVGANDFFFTGLHVAGNTSNTVGSKVTPVTASQLPGLNTLGISLARIDCAPSSHAPSCHWNPHPHWWNPWSCVCDFKSWKMEIVSLLRCCKRVMCVCFPAWSCALPEKRGSWQCCCHCSSQQPKPRSYHNC